MCVWQTAFTLTCIWDFQHKEGSFVPGCWEVCSLQSSNPPYFSSLGKKLPLGSSWDLAFSKSSLGLCLHGELICMNSFAQGERSDRQEEESRLASSEGEELMPGLKLNTASAVSAPSRGCLGHLTVCGHAGAEEPLGSRLLMDVFLGYLCTEHTTCPFRKPLLPKGCAAQGLVLGTLTGCFVPLTQSAHPVPTPLDPSAHAAATQKSVRLRGQPPCTSKFRYTLPPLDRLADKISPTPLDTRDS